MASLAPLHFSTLSHKRYDFRRTLLNIKCVSWFSLQLLSKTFLIIIRNMKTFFMKSTRYSCRILMKLQFSWQIFEIGSNIKFHQNPSSEVKLFHAGRRTDMTKSLFAILRKAPKKNIRKCEWTLFHMYMFCCDWPSCTLLLLSERTNKLKVNPLLLGTRFLSLYLCIQT
jgi:hypothetical protein